MPPFRDDPLNYQKRLHRLDSLRSQLWRQRSSYDSHWRELGQYLMPRRTRFWAGEKNQSGNKGNQSIIDSTGRFAARTLASGLHAGLTSPARPWMKLTTHDPALAKKGDVNVWLHQVSTLMLTMFATTNLYNCLPVVYGDLGIFGTAAMSIVGDKEDLFRAYPYPIGSYVLGLDHRQTVCTFLRDYELSVRQVVEEFGVQPGGRDIDWGNISPWIHNLWDRGDYEQNVLVVWCVMPNPEYRRDNPQSKFKKYLSLHYERGLSAQSLTAEAQPPTTFLRESGFDQFPIMAPRWDITGEDTYGTDCPGMTALGDVKQLQFMQRKKAQAISKQVDPPLSGPSSLRTSKTSLLPGDITYVDVREGMQGLRAIHEVTLDLGDLLADIREVQSRIKTAFYEDLFLALLNRSDDDGGVQPLTAREVDERHEEKLLALGPVLERTNDELLDPIVDRVYHLMELAGLIPPPPKALDGVNLKVEYISILAQAQKLVGVTSQDRLIQSVTGLVQVWPEAKEKLDVYAVVDSYADMLDVDPSIIVSTDMAKGVVTQQQQAQAAQQKAELAATTAKAGKDASQTPMTGDTALSRMVANAQPGPGAGKGGGSQVAPSPLSAPGPALSLPQPGG